MTVSPSHHKRKMPGFSFSGRVSRRSSLSARSSCAKPLSILLVRGPFSALGLPLLLQLESPSFSLSFSLRVSLLPRIPPISFVSESSIPSLAFTSQPLLISSSTRSRRSPFPPSNWPSSRDEPAISQRNRGDSTPSSGIASTSSIRYGFFLDRFLPSSLLYPSTYGTGAFGQDFPPSPTHPAPFRNHQNWFLQSIKGFCFRVWPLFLPFEPTTPFFCSCVVSRPDASTIDKEGPAASHPYKAVVDMLVV